MLFIGRICYFYFIFFYFYLTICWDVYGKPCKTVNLCKSNLYQILSSRTNCGAGSFCVTHVHCNDPLMIRMLPVYILPFIHDPSLRSEDLSPLPLLSCRCPFTNEAALSITDVSFHKSSWHCGSRGVALTLHCLCVVTYKMCVISLTS